MQNITTYVSWRGDLSFAEHPLNELDNLVFCQLAYIDMGPVFQKAKAVSIRDMIHILLASGQLKAMVLGPEHSEPFEEFVTAVAESKRFGPLMIEHYRDTYDLQREVQFSAATFRIDQETAFIAFRGTDDSLVGWKEDFMLSFRRIPAQEAALQYLNEVLREDCSYYLGGHSKGANLALYGALRLPPETQTVIRHIFVNDGPGLCEEVLDTSAITRLDDITTKIVPEYDVIGRLFEMPITDNRIVKSSAKGLMQHDMLTWELKSGQLDTVDDYAPGSNWIGTVLTNWLNNVPTEEREILVNDLFDAIAAAGVESFNELDQLGHTEFETILGNIAQITPISWEVATALPLSAAVGVDGAARVKALITGVVELFTHNWVIQTLALFLGGGFCLLLPENLLPLTIALALSVLAFGIVANTVKMLKQSGWDFNAVQTQANISIFAIAMYIVLLIKENALVLISNIVYGVLLLYIGYKAAGSAGKMRKGSAMWLFRAAEALALWVLALFILIAPLRTMSFLTFSGGILLCVVGGVKLIRGLYGFYVLRRHRTKQ